MSDIKTALKIYRKLVEKGQLDRETEGDLFLEFRNVEVRAILAEFEEELDFKTIEVAGTLYLLPNSGNGVLGFTTKDIRESVATDARLVDAYLLSYISMFILYLFYGGRNRNPKQREFLRISKLIEELDRRFAMALADREQVKVLEENYALNFTRIAELWDSKQDFEERGRKTKTGTILNTCRLLERENLLRLVDEDRELRPTRKLDDLMLNYYLDDSRVEEIKGFFEGAELDA
ncbi:DUF6063 family protein [Desulfosporosinus sp. BICA1-9]|uniref:DUF6063 family protein n=1 Tax=Desulfosporosinus sp. BICA1-9 TaxID=1531958 RepID=UPI00054B02DA|nr:DUF6063 family protein [Desulfosporosinus sp. BICA1-9]KJS48807.1 MAG: hypothetical protein VR66_11985 [Peptococcaceae bacterium BRH_c23]KJS77801.1 MAG: hypothetical protein JL57_32925 [Desulfosporosinus sp. BICA1-9]HBW34765.1 hypothetical protein [Desulfosporosinus sp.]